MIWFTSNMSLWKDRNPNYHYPGMGNIQVYKAPSTVQLGKEKHKPRILQWCRSKRESYNAPIVKNSLMELDPAMDLSQAADSSFVRGADGMITFYAFQS